jgi:microcystin-dependent protein
MPTPDSQRFYRIPGSGGDFGLMMRRGDAWFAIWQGAFFGRWVTFDDAQTYGDPSADRSVALRPTQAPARSIPGEGKVVFDNALKQFVASEDGKEFLPLRGVPIGVPLPYGGTTAPPGFFMCDGAAVSRAVYARLFAVLSTRYGAGDGSTTFNLPDMRGRFPLGKAPSGTGSTLGETGGDATALTTHRHGFDHDHYVAPVDGPSPGSTTIDGPYGGATNVCITGPTMTLMPGYDHQHNVHIPQVKSSGPYQTGTSTPQIYTDQDGPAPPFQTFNWIIAY